MHDMKAKGRASCKKGEQNPTAKLREQDIREIRELAKEVEPKYLGLYYGVTKEMIGQIIRRKAWAHLT